MTRTGWSVTCWTPFRRAASWASPIRAEESLTKSMGQKVTYRTREQVSQFFAGLDLVDPGVVPIQEWRADSVLDLNNPPTGLWGGAARKP